MNVIELAQAYAELDEMKRKEFLQKVKLEDPELHAQFITIIGESWQLDTKEIADCSEDYEQSLGAFQSPNA